MATWGEIVVAILFVDFFSGLVHWFEDQYGSLRMPAWAVKSIVKPNRLHHIYPRKVAHSPWWISSIQGVGVAIVFLPLTVALLGWRTGMISSVLSILPNFVHKWNHQRDAERPRLVKVLHALYILQGPRHHNMHHVGRTDSTYCVVTLVLNPILDGVGFWRGVESLIFWATGIQANSPEEPHRYYRKEEGRIMEYQFAEGIWREWPESRAIPARGPLNPW